MTSLIFFPWTTPRSTRGRSTLTSVFGKRSNGNPSYRAKITFGIAQPTRDRYQSPAVELIAFDSAGRNKFTLISASKQLRKGRRFQRGKLHLSITFLSEGSSSALLMQFDVTPCNMCTECRSASTPFLSGVVDAPLPSLISAFSPADM